MTIQEFAKQLQGREYPFEPRKEEVAMAKANRWVIVFGASDDLVEFRGAVYDEDGAPGVHLIGKSGLLQQPDDEEMETLRKFGHDWNTDISNRALIRITSHWMPNDPKGASWAYEVNADHATFDVMEDGEIYCRGMVVAL